jgi:23S rRNA pseudouridine1911/1915/1917 synthase
MDIPVLFENDVLLVVDKPAGLVVNRAQSVKVETLQDWVERKYSNLTNPTNRTNENQDFLDRAGIVHRIDKETSGCLIIAKTPEAFADLQRQFKERLVKKTYIALVHGQLTPEEGEVRAPVGRLPWNRERFGIIPGGKEAVTRYKVLSSTPDVSRVELYPETGRTHQIRVHMKHINHPLMGDYLYAGRKTSRNDRAGGFPRVMLHAAKIEFQSPQTHEGIVVEAPIPADMLD